MNDTELEKLILYVESIKEITLKHAPKEMKIRMEAFFTFRHTLNDETDRGCTLMAAAFLDEELENLIKAHLVDSKKAIKSVFDNSGALGTFSSRIDISFLLGLIPKNIYDDLHILRKIRNDFAHNSAPITFSEPEISQRINALQVHQLKNKHRERTIFLRTMSSILLFIILKIQNAVRFKSEEYFEHTGLDMMRDQFKDLGIPYDSLPT